MRRNDFRDAAVKLSYEMGAQHKIDRDEIIWWFEESDKRRTRLPPQGGDYCAVDNFKAKLKRTMEAAKPAYFALQSQTNEEKDKWKAYLDKCLGDIRSEFETKFEAIKGDIDASTDIALDAGLKVDGIAKAFQGIFSSQMPITKTVSTQAVLAKTVPKQIEPTTTEEPKKSLAALAELKKPNARALAAAKNFKLTPEMRVLRFLDELNEAAGVAEMRRAGLVGDDGRPQSLEALLAEMDLARGLLVFDDDTDTYDLSEKAEDLLNEADEIAHLPKAEPITRPSAFEKIEEGLFEALAFARGEPNHAKVHTPPVSIHQNSHIAAREVAAEAPKASVKPALTVVPPAPARRILEPTRASRIMPPNLSVKDELLVYLYWDECDGIAPKTTEELKMVVPPLRGFPSSPADIGSVASAAKGTGHITQERKGGPWHLTRLGRDRAMERLGLGHRGELRHKFGK